MKEVPRVSGKSRAHIEGIAASALKKLMPEAFPIRGEVNVLRFFDRLDEFDPRLNSGVDELGPGVLGQMRPNGEVLLSPSTYESLRAGVPRARFTAAHECGHAILHFSQVKERITDGELVLYRRSDVPAYLDPEWQANAFAAALLMPGEAVRKIMEKEPNNCVRAVARFFNVSQESAKIRVNTLTT